MVEVPLLFEGRMHEIFDATIAVIADDEVRTDRASARGTVQLEGRHSRQLPQHEKAALATFVVHNNGHIDELEEELRRLYPQLAAARQALSGPLGLPRRFICRGGPSLSWAGGRLDHETTQFLAPGRQRPQRASPAAARSPPSAAAARPGSPRPPRRPGAPRAG